MGLDVADVETETQRVIGGEPVADGEYAATGALLANWESGLSFACSGTLIAPQVVVTAGHCVHPWIVGEEPPSFTLHHDAHGADVHQIVAGAEAYMHPEFDLEKPPGLGLTRWNDIGVLILAEPIEGVPLEPLASVEEAAQLEKGMAVELVGYGMVDIDSYEAGIKHKGLATLMEVGDHELLISNFGEQQNCHGDSGGPAFVDFGHGRRLVGVVSRSPDSNPVCDHGGVDTRVDPYLDWLRSVVNGSCAAAGSRCTGPNAEPDRGEIEPATDEAEGGGCRVGPSSAPGAAAALALALIALVLTSRRNRR